MIDDLAGYLAPTSFVNSDALPIVELAADITRGAGDPVERACRLVYAVRDGIRYTAYQLELEPQALQATHVLETGRGWCVSKSVLLAALCRAARIPCRLAYANVRNHMATRKLLEYMGTDVFYYHGYNEIYLAGRWVKATVAFNRSLCEKAHVGPLDFDGVHDSIYHPYDLQGQRVYGVSARLRLVRRRAVRSHHHHIPRSLPEYPLSAGERHGGAGWRFRGRDRPRIDWWLMRRRCAVTGHWPCPLSRFAVARRAGSRNSCWIQAPAKAI